MGKHCETFDHTADVGLSARADTLGELFEALVNLGEFKANVLALFAVLVGLDELDDGFFGSPGLDECSPQLEARFDVVRILRKGFLKEL